MTKETHYMPKETYYISRLAKRDLLTVSIPDALEPSDAYKAEAGSMTLGPISSPPPPPRAFM